MIDTEEDMKKEEQSKSIESRKKLNFWARFVLSLVVFGTFLLLLYLLFFQEVGTTYRDIVNILVGSFVAILTKTADYWFKDKDDPEHKETEKLNTTSTTTTNGITP
tara:strand:+ start:304 stop:621 length:318 start_codon:yes stop_codon:yes gene_type:complete